MVNQQASETHGQGDLIRGLEQVFSILLPKELKSSDSCVTVLPDSKLRGSILLKSCRFVTKVVTKRSTCKKTEVNANGNCVTLARSGEAVGSPSPTLAGFGRFGILVDFYVDEIEYMFYNLVKENYHEKSDGA